MRLDSAARMDLRKQAPTITAVCLTVLTGIAIAGSVFWLRPVLVPFVLAIFLSICVTPIVEILHRRARIPQVLAIVATLLIGMTVLVLLAAICAQAVDELQSDRDAYAQQIDRLQQDFLVPFLGRLGIEDPLAVVESLEPRQGLSLISLILAELLQIASDGAVVLIYLFFLLASHSTFGESHGTWHRIRRTIAQYISLKVGISAATALLVWITLATLGVPLAVVFGLLTFALNFIPNVGSMIAMVLPIPVVLMHDAFGPGTKVAAIAIPSTIHFVIGNVLEPRLMGRSLDLHPVAVLLGLLVWGMLWGVVGVFLAVPLTSGLKIVFEELGYTQPIADLFAGRASANGPQPEQDE
jgi:AI-2 transport protein TqsA